VGGDSDTGDEVVKTWNSRSRRGGEAAASTSTFVDGWLHTLLSCIKVNFRVEFEVFQSLFHQFL